MSSHDIPDWLTDRIFKAKEAGFQHACLTCGRGLSEAEAKGVVGHRHDPPPGPTTAPAPVRWPQRLTVFLNDPQDEDEEVRKWVQERGLDPDSGPGRAITMVGYEHRVTYEVHQDGRCIPVDLDSSPIVREHLGLVLAEVLAERVRQDAEWGGPTHDAEHTPDEWFAFIQKQAMRGAASAAKSAEHRLAQPRDYLVKIAALALAALENRRGPAFGHAARADRVALKASLPAAGDGTDGGQVVPEEERPLCRLEYKVPAHLISFERSAHGHEPDHRRFRSRMRVLAGDEAVTFPIPDDIFEKVAEGVHKHQPSGWRVGIVLEAMP